MQASGEAQYTTDIPSLPNELAAAFVLSTQVSELYRTRIISLTLGACAGALQ